VLDDEKAAVKRDGLNRKRGRKDTSKTTGRAFTQSKRNKKGVIVARNRFAKKARREEVTLQWDRETRQEKILRGCTRIIKLRWWREQEGKNLFKEE